MFIFRDLVLILFNNNNPYIYFSSKKFDWPKKTKNYLFIQSLCRRETRRPWKTEIRQTSVSITLMFNLIVNIWTTEIILSSVCVSVSTRKAWHLTDARSSSVFTFRVLLICCEGHLRWSLCFKHKLIKVFINKTYKTSTFFIWHLK